MRLRDYQEAAIEGIRNSYRRKRRSPLFVLPTGGGKTRCLAAIAKSCVERDNRCCILVHRRELIEQTSAALTEIGVAHGVIAPGYPPQFSMMVQVASVQTIVRRLDLVGDFQFILTDEAHHAPADSYKQIIARWPDAWRLGVTATPCRNDGRPLNEIFDEIIEGPSIAQLIDQGYLSPAKVYAPKTSVDFGELHLNKGDFDTAEAEDAMSSVIVIGDVISHYRERAHEQPAIAFCVSVSHAKKVAQMFRDAGYRAASVDGTDTAQHRSWAIQALATGEIHVLTSCAIISEGTDIPRATAAILLRPTMSLSLYLQMVGRVLRPVYAPGMPLENSDQRKAAIAAGEKPFAVVLDHVENVFRLGLHIENREWSLDVAQPKPKKDGRKTSELVPCDDCGFTVKRGLPSCPECGFVFPVKTPVERRMVNINGDLVEIDTLALSADPTLQKIRLIGLMRKYKPAWASLIVRDRHRNHYHEPIDTERAAKLSAKQLNIYLTGQPLKLRTNK